MTSSQRRTSLITAIVCGFLSLPMVWFSFPLSENPVFRIFNMDDVLSSHVNITGLTGSVNILFTCPLWFIVGLGIASSVLQLMRASSSFTVPPALVWATAVISVVWIVLAVGSAVASGKATIGIGSFLGLASAVIPMTCLLMTPRISETTESTF